jgi:hypothetical protein
MPGESAGVAVRTSEPWLDFFDANGNRYWFNFRTGQRTATAPAGHAALHLLSHSPASTLNSLARDAEEGTGSRLASPMGSPKLPDRVTGGGGGVGGDRFLQHQLLSPDAPTHQLPPQLPHQLPPGHSPHRLSADPSLGPRLAHTHSHASTVLAGTPTFGGGRVHALEGGAEGAPFAANGMMFSGAAARLRDDLVGSLSLYTATPSE